MNLFNLKFLIKIDLLINNMRNYIMLNNLFKPNRLIKLMMHWIHVNKMG